LIGSSLVLTLSFTYLYLTDTRASVHQWLIVPLLRQIYSDAEEAHKIGNKALKALATLGLNPRERGNVDALGDLKVEVFGQVLDNPIGTSAGIDKNGEIPSPLLALGPGIVEVGGITPFPQDGNPKPRVWRIPSQNAIINRYGLNSEGADAVAMRLRQRVRDFAYRNGFGSDTDAEMRILDGEAGVPPGSLMSGRLMAVQCAKMKTTPGDDIDAVAQDYVYCVDRLAKYADILVVNVSSPNTPGLRNLQATAPLTKILTSVVNAAQQCDRKTKPPVMVKVSPDEDSDDQVRGICEAVWNSGVDGIIVGNTTQKRPDPLPAGYNLSSIEQKILLEQGGYSGPQLFDRTVNLVAKYRSMLDQGALKSSIKHDNGSNKDVEKDPATRRIDDSIARDTQRLKPMSSTNANNTDQSMNQPLLQLPERHTDGSSSPSSGPAISMSHHLEQGAQPVSSMSSATAKASNNSQKDIVLFATGGVTNGKQALEVLNAGASVAMVYTALVYGGAGTISRIKKEMRDEISTNDKN